MATPEAFGDDAFELTRLRWEAPRELARLEQELQELHLEYSAKSREVRLERDAWQEIAYPSDFRDAIEAAGASTHRVYWNLRHAGISSFGDAAAKTDDELLAIEGIGPVALGIIRRVLSQHAR